MSPRREQPTVQRVGSFYKQALYAHPEAEDLLHAIAQTDMERAEQTGPCEIAEPARDEYRVRTAQEVLWDL